MCNYDFFLIVLYIYTDYTLILYKRYVLKKIVNIPSYVFVTFYFNGAQRDFVKFCISNNYKDNTTKRLT